MAPRAWDYPWSSAADHCGWLRASDVLAGSLEKTVPGGDWQAFLQDEDEAGVARLRQRTRTGRPCGEGDFIAKIEALLGRSLRPAKRGPKPNRSGEIQTGAND
jgi:putative transposase